jgi:hypothetical protein
MNSCLQASVNSQDQAIGKTPSQGRHSRALSSRISQAPAIRAVTSRDTRENRLRKHGGIAVAREEADPVTDKQASAGRPCRMGHTTKPNLTPGRAGAPRPLQAKQRPVPLL